MPIYPAIALLLGCALVTGGSWIRNGTRILCAVSGIAAIVVLYLLYSVRGLPAPGDIASALSSHPAAYKLSLGHMEDLTIESFAYLRLPLAVAAVAFLIGCFGTLRPSGRQVYFAAAMMMVVFFHAARLALVVFDPYMSSRPLADALLAAPPGRLVVNHHYYEFSSVFFYTQRDALLLNGRFNNLVYGSYAPAAPPVFIEDGDFVRLWHAPERYYFVVDKPGLARIAEKVPRNEFYTVRASGGKFLLCNHPMERAVGSANSKMRPH